LKSSFRPRRSEAVFKKIKVTVNYNYTADKHKGLQGGARLRLCPL